MNFFFTSAVALTVPVALMAGNLKPAEAPVGRVNGKMEVKPSPSIDFLKAPSSGHNVFFEGFEERPEGITMSAREWLPRGWLDESKSGHTPTSTGHNLTWQVLDEDSKQTIGPVVYASAHEGYCFAYIMADVAYGDHTELDVQDEWLITPSATPGAEDWFYFKLWFNPGWTVYNRAADDFTGQNNSLEVYLSEDDGVTWKKVWSLIDDYIGPNFTQEQLRASLIDTQNEYHSIYVNVHEYMGKSLKFAFRYFGSLGLPMAVDNVALGFPAPDASYTIPKEAFKQGLSPAVEYPVNPRMYIPYDHEMTWVNTSKEYLNNEWAYVAAGGENATAVTKDLVTPPYALHAVCPTPTLTSFFESASTDPFCVGYDYMQAGGILYGNDDSGYEGEFGVGFYDITEPGHSIRFNSEYISFNPDIDLAWEKIQGLPDGSVDVDGICNMYYYGGVPYGFDYVDMVALVKETLDPDSRIFCHVFGVNDNGELTGSIASTVLYGKDIPAADPTSYVNLRFKFDVPVFVDTNILVMLTNPCRNEDGEVAYQGNIVFPFVKSVKNPGNSLVYQWVNTEYTGYFDGFFNLNSFPFDNGRFGGLLMNLGVSYSDMELVEDKSLVIPASGGSETLKLRAHHLPERWTLTTDGVTPAKGITHEAALDEVAGFYNVTINFAPNDTPEAIDGTLRIASPGSYVDVPLTQASGIDAIRTDSTVKVASCGDEIAVDGAYGDVAIYNAAGAMVACKAASGHRTVINISTLPKGVYIVRVDGSTSVKIVR